MICCWHDLKKIHDLHLTMHNLPDGIFVANQIMCNNSCIYAIHGVSLFIIEENDLTGFSFELFSE